jgi:hypothetical protein
MLMAEDFLNQQKMRPIKESLFSFQPHFLSRRKAERRNDERDFRKYFCILAADFTGLKSARCQIKY